MQLSAGKAYEGQHKELTIQLLSSHSDDETNVNQEIVPRIINNYFKNPE